MKNPLSFLKQNNLKHIVIVSSIFLLGLTLLIRLVDQLKLLYHFPGGFINDLSSYLAQLYFLDACGFHNFCSYWYNGFTAFLMTPPGWYFFAYPFYLIFGDVKIATYVSLLFIFLFAFLAVYFLGKKLHLKPLHRIFIFLLFFGNANAIRGFLRSGRPHELLAWFFFLTLFLFFLYYKDRPLTKWFFLTSILYTATILTYFSTAIYASFLFLSLFLIKKGRERLTVVIAALLGLLLSSFWLIPFLTHIQQTSVISYNPNKLLFSLDPIALLKQFGAFLFPIAFFTVFYLSWKEKNKSRKYLLFYAPFLLLAFLFLFRITPFFPFLRIIPPTQYFSLFILLAGYIYITLSDKQKLSYILINLALVIGVVASTVLSLFFTPYFEVQNKNTQDVIELLPFIEGRYVALGLYSQNIYSKSLVSYASIYYQLNTTTGWYPHIKSDSYKKEVNLLKQAFDDKQCSLFMDKLRSLDTQEVITYTGCDFLAQCGMNLKVEKNGYCLYST